MAEVIEIDINAKDNTSKAAGSAKKNFQDLGRELNNIGRTMTNIFTRPIMDLERMIMKNKEVQEALLPVQEAFKKVGDELAVSLVPVIKELTPALLSLAASLSQLVGWFSALSPTTKEAIISFIGIVAALGPMLVLIGQVITAVSTLSAAWGAVVAFFTTGSGAAFGTAVAGIFGAITAPIWLLIGAIVLLGVTIAIFGKDAWNTIQTIGKIFEALWLLIRIKIDEIKRAFTSVDWGAIGRNIMEGIRNGINQGISWIVNAARNAAQAAVNAARSLLGINSPSLVFAGIGKNMMQGMAKGIDSNAGQAISSTSKAVSATIPAATTSVSSNGGGGTPFVYAPMISLANEAEAERVLLPMLRKLQRAA